jgi:hypothetical protein
MNLVFQSYYKLISFLFKQNKNWEIGAYAISKMQGEKIGFFLLMTVPTTHMKWKCLKKKGNVTVVL